MSKLTIHHEQETRMTGPGSAGNVISALASFVYPGLGQLVQGRVFAALIFFMMATLLWFFLLGWIMHLWAAIDLSYSQSASRTAIIATLACGLQPTK
jgi:TM2 domain-containing membrane protein YozV